MSWIYPHQTWGLYDWSVTGKLTQGQGQEYDSGKKTF